MPAEIQKCHKPTRTTTNVEIKDIRNSRFSVCPSRYTVHKNTKTIFTLSVPFRMSGAKENIEQHSFHTLLCDLLPSPSQLAYSCLQSARYPNITLSSHITHACIQLISFFRASTTLLVRYQIQLSSINPMQ